MKLIKLAIAGAALLLGAITATGADRPTGTPARSQGRSAAATDPLSKANRLPPSLERKVRDFQNVLTSGKYGSYEFARGYWTLWGAEDCKYPIRTVGTCYGNNPTAPYVLAIVPQWGDEFFDQRMHHVLTEPRRNMIGNYRLGEREALVVLAEMPPPARYFGIGTNVFTRETPLNPKDQIYLKIEDLAPELEEILFEISPNPARMMMLASIGDAINNVIIERESRSTWRQQRVFVITADEAMADEMMNALADAGIDKKDVFTERVSPDLVRVGYGSAADDLITYIRYSLPDDPAEGAQWRKQLPLTVLRVRDAVGSSVMKPFPVPTYVPRDANPTYDESALAPDLDKLVAAVRSEWPDPGELKHFFSAYLKLDLVGQHCLGYPDPNRGPMNCIGDTQDADYQISQSLWIDDEEVIAVVGTLGTATGNATYVSVSVNRFPLLVGVQNLDDIQLKGSAAKFKDALDNDHTLFYVHYLARDCTGLSPCLEVPKNLVPRGETIKFIQRNYVNPRSTVGPDPTKILNPVAIVLNGRNRPAPQ